VNQSLKNFLLIAAKNAVNAIITSGSLAVIDSGNFNFHSPDGWWNIGKACLSAVLAREVVVWGPIIMSWSTTNADPGVQVIQPVRTNAIKPKPPDTVIQPKP
jgi:hypothetical protein